VQSVAPSHQPRRVFPRLLFVIIGIVALYALLAGVVFPRVLRQQAVKRLSALTGTQAEIQKVTFHPFALRLSISGVLLRDLSNAPLLTWSNLVADVELASIWRAELFLKELRVEHPNIWLKRNSDESINLLALVERVQSQLPPADTNAPSSGLFPLTIARVTATNGAVAFRDDFVPGTYETRIAPFNLALQDLTTGTNQTGQLEFTASGDHGQRFSLAGSLGLQPLLVDAAFRASDISLPPYRPYSDGFSTMAPTSGVVALEIPFQVSSTPTGITVRVVQGKFNARQLAVVERTNSLPVLSTETLQIDGINASLAEHTGSVERFAIDDCVLHVRRTPGGESNLQGMVEPETIERLIDESSSSGIPGSTSWTRHSNHPSP
jgi:hypothetical protein